MPWDMIFSLGSVVVLLALGITVGRTRERRHLADLTRREQAYRDMGVTNLRWPTAPDTIARVELVSGDVVIASDYFKTFTSAYRKLIGGEMRAYERLVQRARREATLRMMEQARAIGALEVWNVRLEMATLGQATGQRGVMCEAFAYGTAVVRKASPPVAA